MNRLIQQTYDISQPEDLASAARQISKILPRNSVVLMEGGLGAGKTTFVSEFCKLFGIMISQSPTYAIHQSYTNNEIAVEHFDLYRLETEDEIQSAGFYDLLYASNAVRFVEWSERLGGDQLSGLEHVYKMKFDRHGEKRSLTLVQLA